VTEEEYKTLGEVKEVDALQNRVRLKKKG